MSEKKNLVSKLVDIMAEMGTVAKKGRNEFHKYDYIRESDVSEKMQDCLVKHRVFIFSSIVSSESQQVGSSILSTVQVEYTFVDADNPEDKFTVSAAGDGIDKGDKAIYKAITGAHKYFLIRNFNLGSDEDAEKHSPVIGKGTIPKQAVQKKKQPGTPDSWVSSGSSGPDDKGNYYGGGNSDNSDIDF